VAIADLFRQASEHHQAGRLPAAEALYLQILQSQPEHADALHLLGVVTHQRGDQPKAVELIRRAIALNGKEPTYRSNLAVALRAMNRVDEAVAELQEAVRMDPNYAAGHKNLGIMLGQMGRHRLAARHLQRALELVPRDQGTAKSLGVALINQGRHEEAVEAFARAVQLKPDDPEAENNLGVALKDIGRFDVAAAHLRKAIELRPDFVEAHNNLGTVFSLQRKLDEAAACYREALRIKPDYTDALHNLGVTLRDLGQVEDGLEYLWKALKNSPGDAETRNNIGAALQAQGNFAEAMTQYEQALRIKPDHVWARFNRSTVLLTTGDFEHGWLEYEWRLKRPGFQVRQFGRPLWDGTSDPKQTLLLYTEQGLGDTLQFIRYASLARQRVGRVVVECQDLLLPILARCKDIDQIVPRGAALPPFDCHAPLMSLPGILGGKDGAIPADVPYVFPDPALVEHWRERLRTIDGFKVGINWQGNPQFTRDHHRSMPLAHFAPLAEVPGVRLISLQWGPGREQLTDGSVRFPIADFGDDLDKAAGAFMDRAAIMQGLDLVITSDTAVAHLAGALAVPVWVALSASPDWRYHLDGEKCLWYPSMRLFRQPRLRDWDSVFRRIAERLRETAGGTAARL
jgi:tetratricopeptide (TPR) repeat protein